MKRIPDERVAEVFKLLDANFSFGNIADALHMTRSAVAGLVARYKHLPLPTPASYNPMERPETNHPHRFTYFLFGVEPDFPKPAKPKLPKRLPGKTDRDIINKIKHLPHYATPEPQPAPDSLFLPLLDLPDNGCHFAVGEDEHRHLFCGSPHVSLLPYCAFHCKIAYRPGSY